jgi:diadenosine tetraphosphate (Ap4A) HIT family hydrolase
MVGGWPKNWERLWSGEECPMCAEGRPDTHDSAIRIAAQRRSDAYLERSAIQRGYTIVIWRGSHVVEPTDLADPDAAAYWTEVLRVARAVAQVYRPLKMNYMTLGNWVPHLHTHLVPRYKQDDPNPGGPFPLVPTEHPGCFPENEIQAEASKLRALLA